MSVNKKLKRAIHVGRKPVSLSVVKETETAAAQENEPTSLTPIDEQQAAAQIESGEMKAVSTGEKVKIVKETSKTATDTPPKSQFGVIEIPEKRRKQMKAIDDEFTKDMADALSVYEKNAAALNASRETRMKDIEQMKQRRITDICQTVIEDDDEAQKENVGIENLQYIMPDYSRLKVVLPTAATKK